MSQDNITLRTGLIAINNNTVNGQTIETVNARELHAFLESKQDFSHWIKNLIRDFDFKQGIDFIDDKIIVCDKVAKIEYHLSLDMAKEISMLQRTPKGKEARQYFIECERQAKATPAPVPTLPFDMTDPLSIMDWSKQQFLTFKQREDVKDAIIQEQSRVILSQVEHLEANKEIDIFVKQMQEAKKSKNFTDIAKVLSDAFDYSINAENLRVFCILKGFLTLTGLPSDKLRRKNIFKVFTFYREETGEVEINTKIKPNGLMFLSQEVKPYKVFFTLKRAEWKPLIDRIKDGEKQRRAFIENLKNATHYSTTNQNELMI